MIHITVNNDGKVTEVDAIAYLLIAFEEAAPRYGSISLMQGDFDDEMLDNLKRDFKECVEEEGNDDK